MPASSEKQRKAMAIALHHPSQLHKANRGLLEMSKAQLHEFATKPKKKTALQRGLERVKE